MRCPCVLVVSTAFLKRWRGAADVRHMTSRDGAEAAWASLPTTAADIAADGGASLSEVAMTQEQTIVTLPVDLPTMLRQIENAYVNAALTRTQNNKKEAAKLLGMGRTTLVEKLRRRSAASQRS
ncbi:MAG: sigma54 specific transcriptional regulator, Fis family [Myxococcales bacterium]|nr:sigma54 specific transcriptional regulator, Fis family [Myxococcales bacterium]